MHNRSYHRQYSYRERPTLYDPVSFDLIDYGGKKQIMEAAKACEIAMQEFAMACEYNELHGYGTLEGQHQDIITNTDLAWVQRGVNNPQNLGLYQETEESFNKILDAYGTPSEIFVRQKGATFENQRIAERGMYVRTIIPEANEWAMAVNSVYYPDGKKKLIVDFSHLEIFQDDLKKRADALSSLVTALSKMFQDGAITVEEYKAELKKYGINSNAA